VRSASVMASLDGKPEQSHCRIPIDWGSNPHRLVFLHAS